MYNRLFNLTITRVALFVVALMAISLVALPVYNLAFAQETDTIEYAENGTGAVATYTAEDPEGKDITWSLLETPFTDSDNDIDIGNNDLADFGDFTIENGVLMFKSPPDFEAAKGGPTGTSNTYNVVVQASDGGTRTTGRLLVTVEVTDEDEDGVVGISLRQPQVVVPLMATLAEPDRGANSAPQPIDTSWQWARSANGSSWTDITGATAMDPVTVYTPVAEDVNSYLRATAKYTDGEGADKSASMMSEFRVRAAPSSNILPTFPDANLGTPSVLDQEREIMENVAVGTLVGAPVAASDGDGDVLTYTLGGADANFFDINAATGQLSTKVKVNYEEAGEAEDANGASHTVTVTATDPFGTTTMSVVIITVVNVDEPPNIMEVNPPGDYVEDQAVTVAVAAYTATDPEPNTAAPTWSLSGADRGQFNITAGSLTFKVAPDYEAPGDADRDNLYELMVVATDGEDNSTSEEVMFKVTNMDEDGVVMLSALQPRIGVELTATLEDPDGSISDLTWQWYRDEPTGDLTANAIEDATSATYTPTADDPTDVGVTLWARAMYTDGEGADKSEVGKADNAVALDTRNKPPAFGDQDPDTEGDQTESAERKVAENTKAVDPADDGLADNIGDNVGMPVTAEDPNSGDRLTYTLGGPVASLFRVRQDDQTTNDNEGGQIEVAAGTELDYEMTQIYTVTVTATDSFQESATITVTIKVTDMDEMPDLDGVASENYAENGTSAVARYTAEDPEGKDITWSLTEIAGPNGEDFTIENGVLMFKSPPDFEAAKGGQSDNLNTYNVMVQASDGGTMTTAQLNVTVTVTDVDEDGVVGISLRQPQVVVPLTATLEDPDGDISNLAWQWARSANGGSWTDISSVTAMTMTYTPVPEDVSNYLRATAEYSDGETDGGTADKSAAMRSEFRVRAEPSSNSLPTFPDTNPGSPGIQAEPEREIMENVAVGTRVGAPVAASDSDGDVLTYTLGGADANFFDINEATGQLSTKVKVNYEEAEEAEDANGASHTVTVTATDPFGTPTTPAAVVTITVINVDEDPEIDVTAAPMDYVENGTDAVADFEADDPEETTAPTWSLSGADRGQFDIDAAGVLTFKVAPDYEAPGDADRDNLYELMVVATDGEDNSTSEEVMFKVTNMDEDGVVMLSSVQPRIGVELTATLEDPDGSISDLTWQWYRSEHANAGPQCDLTETNAIEDATFSHLHADQQTTLRTSVSPCLRARAMYTDGEGADKSEVGEADNAVALDTRNKPPAFPDQDPDTEGDQTESAERKVAENTKAVATDDGVAADDAEAEDNVGMPVTAEDPDPNADPLVYTLSGADAGPCSGSGRTILKRRLMNEGGQIEVAAGTELNYETKQTYMVTLKADRLLRGQRLHNGYHHGQ